MSYIGVDVSASRLRALGSGRRGGSGDAMEVEWDEIPPADSVEALRERFGSGNVIAVALDMSTVFVKRIGLPPLGPAERRGIVTTDPQRYFAVRDEALVVGVRDDDLVVACRAELFDAWTEALSCLGSVERVEPAPAALARHVAAEGLRDCVLVIADPGAHEGTVATLTGGRITALRRCPSGGRGLASVASSMRTADAPYCLVPWHDGLAAALRGCAAEAPVVPMPAPTAAPDSFAAARGAVLGLGQGSELTLESPALAGRLAASARRRAVVHVAAIVAAIAAFGWSLDDRREATLRALEEEIEVRRADAEPVLAMRDEAASVADELALLTREASARPAPLDVLAEVSRILPPGAYLTQLSMSADEWELSGLAPDAASLVPALEGSDLFADVRFRTATTRVRVRDESYESFSLVLRHVPTTRP